MKTDKEKRRIRNERAKKWYREHWEEAKRKKREYMRRNREKFRAYAKKYYREHREKFLRYNHEYYKKKKEERKKIAEDPFAYWDAALQEKERKESEKCG